MGKTYTLKLNNSELERYKLMASSARRGELDAWRKAGVAPGARVADVGCGPAAILVELARLIEPGGSIVGVDSDPEVLATAAGMIAACGLTNAEAVSGEAEATGLEPESFDVIMMRHVLLHNGPRTTVILKHLASLLKPAGHLFLCETDLTGYRQVPKDADHEDLWNRWLELLRRQGNDVEIGPKIGLLLVDAGFKLVDRGARFGIVDLSTGYRHTAYAAEQAMMDAGLASEQNVCRWEEAFRRYLNLPGDKVLFGPHFWAIGRRPTN